MILTGINRPYSLHKLSRADLYYMKQGYSNLKAKLNGQCGMHCPLHFVRHPAAYALEALFCRACYNEFYWLMGKGWEKVQPGLCPCHLDLNPDILFHRLDEFVEDISALI